MSRQAIESFYVAACLSHSDSLKKLTATHLHKRAHEAGKVADRDTLKEAGRNVLLCRVDLCFSVSLCVQPCLFAHTKGSAVQISTRE